MIGLRAIVVSVEYADLLALTLPYNRHHFDEVLVVTSPADTATAEVAARNNARLFVTGSFYAGGAVFNKWLALEQGLDAFGRHGWLAILDADVLWPKNLPSWHALRRGFLYTPLRRMADPIPDRLPDEARWKDYPLHPQQREWAGYSQIFSADDQHLPAPPWHETNWSHAGGADSFFQALWPVNAKRRPPFECLHLGPAGVNWAGRASPYVNGTVHPEAGQRVAQLRRLIRSRGTNPRDRFAHERLPGG